VLLLHSVMKVYKLEIESNTNNSTDLMTVPDIEPVVTNSEPVKNEILASSLTVFKIGLQLLHLILQYNSGFMERHLAVQHKYVEVVCGMAHLFKPLDNSENDSKYQPNTECS